jgi:anthranilate phosphoribosyltransferase
MQVLVQHLKSGGDLNAKQIAEAAYFLTDPQPTPETKATFLKALAKKGETPDEIAGFVEEFLKLAVDPGLDHSKLPGPMLDVVGTGGDKLNLFNVSTTAMFILAAGGVCMVKHGNRGITGKSGGADVLEALGIRIDLPPEKLAQCVQELGIGFLFAPLYHPAFAAVKEARGLLAKEGQRSIFNILGPLMNPARPDYQLVGVFDPKLTSVFGHILLKLGRKAAWIVHGSTNDGRGMDELSTLGNNEVVAVKNGLLSKLSFEQRDTGASLQELVGGDAVDNAAILEGILAGSIKGSRRNLAVLNAAAGFVVTGKTASIEEGVKLANDLIDRGAAHAKLRTMQDFC